MSEANQQKTSEPQTLAVGVVKDGSKTSEYLTMWIGVAVSIVLTAGPVILEKVPPDSVWAVIVGGLISIATLIGGYFGVRFGTKANAQKALASVEAAKAMGAAQPPFTSHGQR